MEVVRVLLVDDEVEFTDALGQRLEARGVSTKTASSGDEALDMLDRVDFDVVLLDLCMPGRDGIETLREIKLRKPLTEVIMLSGKGDEETAIDGMRNGAFDFLTKPPEIGELLTKINDAHTRRAQHHARILNALDAGYGDNSMQPRASVQIQKAVRAAADGDSCDGILLVLGRETEFSDALIEYALEMAGRLDYEVMALNAAGLTKDVLHAFPSARESLWKDFQTHSQENVISFRTAAAEKGIPFSHVVKPSGPDKAVQEVQHEVGRIDFVISEPLGNVTEPCNGPNVLVY